MELCRKLPLTGLRRIQLLPYSLMRATEVIPGAPPLEMGFKSGGELGCGLRPSCRDDRLPQRYGRAVAAFEPEDLPMDLNRTGIHGFLNQGFPVTDNPEFPFAPNVF